MAPSWCRRIPGRSSRVGRQGIGRSAPLSRRNGGGQTAIRQRLVDGHPHGCAASGAGKMLSVRANCRAASNTGVCFAATASMTPSSGRRQTMG
jgi:hypothetical protein